MLLTVADKSLDAEIVISFDALNEISLTEEVIFIPKTLEMLSPILTVIPTYLLAYHIAKLKGYDIDKPRNLAKSVTVE